MSGHDARSLSIAVDGPSGSGKSSASRGVAARLGLAYVDTGAMYRALTWWVLEQGIDIDDPAAVAERISSPQLEISQDPDHPFVRVDGADITAAIREPRIADTVSRISAIPAVRHRLVGEQQEIVRLAAGEGRGVVMEGRDIGTVVLPDADVKIYLTADVDARAARRAREHIMGGADTEEVGSAVATARLNLEGRDALDSTRSASPLAQAADAIVIDATYLTLDEVIDRIVDLALGVER